MIYQLFTNTCTLDNFILFLLAFPNIEPSLPPYLDNIHISRAMTKPDLCLCRNKGTDQLRRNCETDQRLCFRYTIVQFLYFLNPNFRSLAICACTSWFVWDLVGNPFDWFSYVAAHITKHQVSATTIAAT